MELKKQNFGNFLLCRILRSPYKKLTPRSFVEKKEGAMKAPSFLSTFNIN